MILETTGWYSYDEFTQVYTRLSDPEEYPFIARKIALWRLRGKVPAAVTATESLLCALIADSQRSRSDSELCSLYAMAVIRAVNLVLDHEQDGEYARSMLFLAKQCDLPEYIIQVRHECSHREIPDLHTLRVAVLDAINYLYKRYWSAQYKSIMFKLNNVDYNMLQLESLLIWSYSTVLTKLDRSAVDPILLWNKFPNSGCTAGKLLHSGNPYFKSAVKVSNRALRLLRNLLRLSINRRYTLLSQTMSTDQKQYGNAVILKLVPRVSMIARKLVEGCVHSNFFISVFVEFVFAHFDSSLDTVFTLLFLDIVSQMPYNFIIELCATMLCVVFGLSDVLADENDNNRWTLYGVRISEYDEFLLSPPAEFIRNTLAIEVPKSKCSLSHRDRINSWMINLLRCANHVDNKYHCHELPVPLQVIVCADTKEARRLYIASGNALVRLSSGFQALLPNVIAQLSLNNKSRSTVTSLKKLSWEDDPLSHALCLYEWLSQSHAVGILKDYQFVTLDDIEIQKRLDVISSKHQDKYANIDMMLSPGTYWDAHRWRIQFTVKRLEASKVYHSRIIDTLRSLLRGTNKSDGLWTKKSGQQVVYGLDNSDATLQPIRQFLKLVAGLGAALNPLSYRQRFS